MASVGSPTQPGSGQFQHLSDHAKIKAFLDGHFADDPIHNASGIVLDPSGLLVVTTANVQAAIGQLDGQLPGKATPMGTWTGPNTVYPLNAIVKPPAGSVYTGAWRCKVAHLSGATFTGPTSGNWERWGAEALADLNDLALGTLANNDTLIFNQASGRWQNSQVLTPQGEIALASNESAGAGAPQSVNGAGGAGSQQTIPNLSVTVLQGQTRPVYLAAEVAMSRDDTVNIPASCTIIIYETTPGGSAALAAAGQSVIGWTATVPMPMPPIVAFTLSRRICQITPAMTIGIDRTWSVAYYVGSGAPGIVKAHATLAAPVSGIKGGAYLLAERK